MSRPLQTDPPGSPPGQNPFADLTLEQLRERQSLKWRAFPPDVLPLWVAEMDTRLAPAVVEAVSRALADGDTGYPQGTDYIEALVEFALDRWAWVVNPADVRLVADVMNGMVEILELVTERGDAVIVTPPVYPPFFAFVGHRGRKVVTAPLGPDHRLDLGALERAFETATEGGRSAALLLANPHNPTGTVPTPAELTAVAALAERFGVRVLVDEIHAPLTFDAPFTPYLSVPGGERGFAVTSASKGWHLAGFKAALVIAGSEAVADLARMPPEVSHGASALGALAHSVALRSGVDWLEDCRAGLDANRRLLAELVREHLPQVGYRMPEATYLAWLDCRALGLGDDPAAVFLDRARVAVNSGQTFGPGGAGHVRLNFATSPAIITEAVERMAGSL